MTGAARTRAAARSRRPRRRRRGGVTACDACLRRTALIAALSGRLDVEWRRREVTARVLALTDEALLALGRSAAERAYARFDAAAAAGGAARRGPGVVCRCDDALPGRGCASWPTRRRCCTSPAGCRALATRTRWRSSARGGRRRTGSRSPRALGRGLSAAGVPVVSGLALGVDSAAHAGALRRRGRRWSRCWPAAPTSRTRRASASCTRRSSRRGCVVSELPPGFGPIRWCFVARNRIIAALARVTVIVEAAERSGSLTTADFAAELGRTVGAVPGRITARRRPAPTGCSRAARRRCAASPTCSTCSPTPPAARSRRRRRAGAAGPRPGACGACSPRSRRAAARSARWPRRRRRPRRAGRPRRARVPRPDPPRRSAGATSGRVSRARRDRLPAPSGIEDGNCRRVMRPPAPRQLACRPRRRLHLSGWLLSAMSALASSFSAHSVVSAGGELPVAR